MRNNIKLVVIITSLFVLALQKVHAADLNIYCDDNVDNDQCSTIGATSLFNEKDWYPGKTSVKTIYVKNDDHNDDCNLKIKLSNLSGSSDLTKSLFVAIKSGGDVIYGGVLNDKATNAKTVDNIINSSANIGHVNKNGGTGNYEWIITLDTNAGNNLQNAHTLFDFRLSFSCEHNESNSTDTSNNSTSTIGESISGAVQGVATQLINAVNTPEQQPKNTKTVEIPNTSTTTPNNQEPKVLGATTCSDPSWWWLVFIAQIIAQYIVFLRINKKSIDIQSMFYTAEVVLGVVFGVIFYIFFCPIWDIFVSLGITAVISLIVYSKLTKLRN